MQRLWTALERLKIGSSTYRSLASDNIPHLDDSARMCKLCILWTLVRRDHRSASQLHRMLLQAYLHLPTADVAIGQASKTLGEGLSSRTRHDKTQQRLLLTCHARFHWPAVLRQAPGSLLYRFPHNRDIDNVLVSSPGWYGCCTC